MLVGSGTGESPVVTVRAELLNEIVEPPELIDVPPPPAGND
jgi:hypothetical protein